MAMNTDRFAPTDPERQWPGRLSVVAVIVASLVVAAVPAPASSQEPGQQFGETMDVRIINIDVVVRDDNGDPVQGLTASDFVLYENGRPQAITNFSEYRADYAKPESPGSEAAVVIRPPVEAGNRPAMEWARILERSWEEVRAILLDESDDGQRLRQSDPFCGILSPDERWSIYREF